ncbi:site-specific DNA-methyltransferase [Fibrella aquatilis]|uniref:site-specific DNA-methyltransferase (adenine-specific) n=1 Tax=Fibrella aquatilis TaxID=2817059 RepID=A0A939G8U6_9BACT|nr:site-specific DNA-methyltransferase [Fibrella aquatilis]MBO0933125.1 site-specific DNA-methyltransferase [Fibrella aquatilis]
MAKNAYQHKATRAFIPSQEEAGTEQDNPTVAGKATATYPKNPVTTRGQDPELFWLNKYGPDDAADTLDVDIRSLYRVEHISPELLLNRLYRTQEVKLSQLDLYELFGNSLHMDELEKVSEYYTHADEWKNRLIQGDSLLVMNSLLQRESMAGKVQMVYIDPPYGIKYNSNWQLRVNDRAVADGKDENLSGEPEQIKAFRDTWELGIHSYLTYLRDRLLVARELLHVSGSCFVQISDENVHLVRCLMDEVFGSENFVSMICVKKTGAKQSKNLDSIFDYVVWYAKDVEQVKYNQLYVEKELGVGKGTGERYDQIELPDKTRRPLKIEEKANSNLLKELVQNGGKTFQLTALISESSSPSTSFEVYYGGQKFYRTNWKTTERGFQNLIHKNRVMIGDKTLRYVRYLDDFPAVPILNYWDDTGLSDKVYVVQTADKVIQRCLLMCTDPGDLVLDPTCGSGTTAYVAEQWGRRWITTDTSRIALNIAKSRLMTATFPFYHLYSDVDVAKEEKGGKIKKTITPLPEPKTKEEKDARGDLRLGFVYEEVPHITLKSLANDEPADTETLYDKPYEDKKRMRVAGAFTVETLQNFEPVSPEEAADPQTVVAASGDSPTELENFEQLVFQRLQSAGINNGDKTQHTKFGRVEPLAGEYLHAEGFYQTAGGTEAKAYIHLGGKYSTVSKEAVNMAVRECRKRGDADWLLILGLSFESDIENKSVSMNVGTFRVDKVRLHDDFLQDGLLKKPNKASGSFVLLGEPDIRLSKKGDEATVEVRGLDIYDPIKDDVRSRDPKDIAYWMVDDDYDGTNFIVRQVFFCGSNDKDEFKKWQKGLSNLATQATKKQAEKTLKIEIDDEAFDRLYGTVSHPIDYRKGRKIAVRVISQFGEESTKVLSM